MRLLVQVLENWTNVYQSLNDKQGIFIYIICTTVWEWWKKQYATSTPKNIFYSLPTDVNMMDPFHKIFFQKLVYHARPATICQFG